MGSDGEESGRGGLTGFLRKNIDRAPTRGMSPSNGSMTTRSTPWSCGDKRVRDVGHAHTTHTDKHTTVATRTRIGTHTDGDTRDTGQGTDTPGPTDPPNELSSISEKERSTEGRCIT